MDRLDPTSPSTIPFPTPCFFFFFPQTLASSSLGSQESKKPCCWDFLDFLPSCWASWGLKRGAPGAPGMSLPQTYLEVRVRSGEPCPLFPETGHHRQAAAPCSVLATATWPRLARGRASAVQFQRGPHCCLATRRMDLKGPGH